MKIHETVLPKEAVEGLHVQKNKKYIDATLGAGGHTIQILERGGIVLGIDADSEMLAVAKDAVYKACPSLINDDEGRFTAVHANFRDISEVAKRNNFDQVSGILFDFGISNIHFGDGRGFSFQKADELLDMRLDPESQGVTAADLMNSLPEKQLEELFSVVLPRGDSKRLSRKIADVRKDAPFTVVGDVLALFKNRPHIKTHPATKAFMALRISVNEELSAIEEALPKALELLQPKGRISAISFHSGEDRIVKHLFSYFEEKGMGREITKKPIVPSLDEQKKNRKSRSAKLRIFEKA